MHIVICDDIEKEAKVTLQYVQKYHRKRALPFPQITIVKNGQELWQQKDVDVVLLDIELQQESGIELAEEINQIYPNVLVAFVSSYPFYVTDSYRVKAVQFLLKPLQEDMFDLAMEQILALYQEKQDYLIRRSEGEPMVIQKNQIVYVRSQKRILTATLASGKTRKYYGKLSDEEKLLQDYGIIKCHKSILVNLNYVRRVDRKGIIVELANGSEQKVPVSESLYQHVYQAYLKKLCL